MAETWVNEETGECRKLGVSKPRPTGEGWVKVFPVSAPAPAPVSEPKLEPEPEKPAPEKRSRRKKRVKLEQIIEPVYGTGDGHHQFEAFGIDPDMLANAVIPPAEDECED